MAARRGAIKDRASGVPAQRLESLRNAFAIRRIEQQALRGVHCLLRVHRRQTEAIRKRDLEDLGKVLDLHLRMLEDAFAAAIGRSSRELFRAVRALT